MARLFNDASSEYMEYTGAVLSGPPFSMACWALTDDVDIAQALMALCSSTGNERFVLNIDGTAVLNNVNVTSTAAGSAATAISLAGFSANNWAHACGVFAANDDRRAFYNGAFKGVSALSRAVGAVNRTNIGTRYAAGVRGTFMSGRIAEAGIWNVALSDVEVAALGSGIKPTRIRPESLVAYWPLWGDESPEPDWHLSGGTRYPMTLTGTVKANHAPIATGRRFWGSAPHIPALGYAEQDRAVNLLVQSAKTELYAMLESGKAVSLLALLGRTDSAARSELAKAVNLLALTGKTDGIGISESDLALLLLVLTGETDGLTAEEIMVFLQAQSRNVGLSAVATNLRGEH